MHGLLGVFQCYPLELVLYLSGTNKPVMVFKEFFVVFICVSGLESNLLFAKKPQKLFLMSQWSKEGWECKASKAYFYRSELRSEFTTIDYLMCHHLGSTTYIACPVSYSFSLPWGLSGYFSTKRSWQLSAGGTTSYCGVNQCKFHEDSLALYKWRLQCGGALNEGLGDHFFTE